MTQAVQVVSDISTFEPGSLLQLSICLIEHGSTPASRLWRG